MSEQDQTPFDRARDEAAKDYVNNSSDFEANPYNFSDGANFARSWFEGELLEKADWTVKALEAREQRDAWREMALELNKALNLALYYVEGDATYEGVKEKVASVQSRLAEMERSK